MRDGLIEIPVLNVDASAGFGAIAESETAHTRFGFDERWLSRLTRAKSASLSIIHVLGDSMEPTLSDGDEVLVDASDEGSRLRDGIYVLRADDALVVKRVTLKPGGRKITISSDNSAYPSWDDVDRSEIQVVGRVIWFGRAV
jgi:phage repressor protein C with HTH and peptisase S24 domain